MKRVYFVLAIVLCGVSGTGSRAQALTEVCPATASHLNVLDAANGAKAGTLFSYELDSLAPETVSGTLSIQTDHGWYQVPFGPVALTEHKESYTMGATTFVRGNVFSEPQYVRFPLPVGPSRVFVSTIRTDDTTFGWPTKVDQECDAGGASFLFASSDRPRASNGDLGPVHAGLAKPPSLGVPVARKTAAFDSLGCAMPFVDAHAKNSVPPNFPAEGAGYVANDIVEVIVAVAIDANGKVTDDWVVAPGPIDVFNRVSLKAAEETTYVPAISRCRPVPGVYLFHADFSKD